VACGLLAWASTAAAQRWQMQYFYDEAKSTLAIQDIAFPSPTHGVAVAGSRKASANGE